jgi:riboflavin synthase
MFTGIITDLGTVHSIERHENGARLVIACSYDGDTIDIGSSIACNGCCLTVVEKELMENNNQRPPPDLPSKGEVRRGTEMVITHPFHKTLLSFDASPHTLEFTTLGRWQKGHHINLERAMKMGDEFGGHIVSGHVDGQAEILNIEEQGDSTAYTMQAPYHLAKYIAAKGSVTLDGVSLTVTWAENNRFGLTIIPHTQAVTNWQFLGEGDRMNLEVDLIARYVERMMRPD